MPTLSNSDKRPDNLGEGLAKKGRVAGKRSQDAKNKTPRGGWRTSKSLMAGPSVNGKAIGERQGRVRKAQTRRKVCNSDEWVNKLWRVCTPEYHSAFKKLTHATTWMDLEDIMLSERSQTQKDKDRMTPLMRGSWGSQIHRDRKRIRGCQGLRGRRNGEFELTGHGFSWG